MSKKITKALLALSAACLLLPGYAEVGDDSIDPDELLYAMREMTVSQGNKDVMGTIRKGRTKTPFSLSSRGKTLIFQFKQGGAWQRFDVRIQEKKVDLLTVQGGKARVMAPSSYTRTIAGTDVCYEDLSMRFLHWKGGQVITDGTDSHIKGRDCFIIQVPNPTPKVGQFAWVRMWVDKENGTAWQIDGYDAQGRLRKRFTITSVQKLDDGSWFFKQMKMEVRDPNNPSRTISLSYLDMDDLKK